MTQDEARSYLNYLLTLGLRREEAFGPLAISFLREQDLTALGIGPEEQFSLIIATTQAIAAEPKRYSLKLELLQKGRQLLSTTRFFDPELAKDLEHDIQKTTAELNIYTEAMKSSRNASVDRHTLIVETDLPEYFLDSGAEARRRVLPKQVSTDQGGQDRSTFRRHAQTIRAGE